MMNSKEFKLVIN